MGHLQMHELKLKLPDLTKKVPRRLKVNVIIDNKSVHFSSNFLLLEISIVWRSAEAVSHGRSDAFSTGSQNQKPPQPNS